MELNPMNPSQTREALLFRRERRSLRCRHFLLARAPAVWVFPQRPTYPEASSWRPGNTVGPGPGSLGFFAETNLPTGPDSPGGRLLAARKYSRPPESSGPTVKDTFGARYGPLSGFYSETSQPGGDTTKYGGEADLGPFNILGEWYTDSPTGAPSVSGGTAGVSGQRSLFGGIVSGELKKSFGPGAGHSARLGWTGGLGSLPGNFSVGADYYDRKGREPFVGANLSYGLKF